jgi:hypothetical protein
MKNLKIDYIRKYLSTNDISFLIDIDKTIEINKSGKAYYFKMFRIEIDLLQNFIFNLNEKQIYMINPIISISSKHNSPYVTLSRQFLITNNSNPVLIHNYLSDQLLIFRDDFAYEYNNYFLIFKYKTVSLIIESLINKLIIN